jgi:murein DD-endopeptidase MepM/ murein hydrolase activator NlpD
MQAAFMEYMIKAMEQSVEADGGLFGNSAGAEIYRGMFREHLAAAMSGQVQGPLQEELERSMTRDAADPAREAVPTIPDPLPLLPVQGRITSQVGWRLDPIQGSPRFHRGTDIAAPEGTAVHAVEGGIVVESGLKGSFGNAVVIATDSGRRMLYAHNMANLVRPGDRVRQGDTIAQVGSTGRATGPHVHFEVME